MQVRVPSYSVAAVSFALFRYRDVCRAALAAKGGKTTKSFDGTTIDDETVESGAHQSRGMGLPIAKQVRGFESACHASNAPVVDADEASHSPMGTVQGVARRKCLAVIHARCWASSLCVLPLR